MTLKTYLFPLVALLIISGSCNYGKPSFSFEHTDQGIKIKEDESPVFFYQREPKTLDGQYVCNNYIHPLYTPGGDILTEESPRSHRYHRGVFWAWTQVYINDQSVGSSWNMDNFLQDVTDVHYEVRNVKARLDLDVLWKSPQWEGGKPFVSEKTTILVHPAKDNIRKIDFEISLRGLTEGVTIGGSDNERGYGGFCLRIKHPEDLTFTSENGEVMPQQNQVVAGSWMDFSGSFGSDGEKSGVVVICHPTTPLYPAPWILRKGTSMQNIVYPGRHRTAIPTGKPVVLRYRLVVYQGSNSQLDFEKLKEEYERFVYPGS